MQNKIQALPETKRVGNQTSLIHTSVTFAFFLVPSFFFAIQSSFLPYKCYILLGSIPVLFQSRTIPHHAFSLRDPIHACGFNYHLGTAGSPPRPRSLDLGLCYLLPTGPLPPSGYHSGLSNSTCAYMLLLNSLCLRKWPYFHPTSQD